MLKNLLLLMVALLAVGCSAERRDVVRYFESMQPHFTELTEQQARLKQISALPHGERAAAYRALATECKATAARVAEVKAPPATQAFHAQYTALWNDFVSFGELLGDVVDARLSPARREEANKQMEALQAAYPAKLKSVLDAQKQLGQQYGIDFQ